MINRLLVCTAFSAVLVAAVPVFAQTSTKMDCTQANMTKANDSMMKMSDASKKQMAMKEMDMAKDMMAKNDEKGCLMHMEKAMDMMK